MSGQFSTTGMTTHSVEAERAVLGGLMLDGQAWARIADKVSESDFYCKDHRLIYRAVAALAEANSPVDVVTISEWLEKNHELQNIGGLSYLALLANNTPSAANIGAYAKIVRDHAAGRRLRSGLVKAIAAFDSSGHEIAAIIAAETIRHHGEQDSDRTNSGVGLLRAADLPPQRIDWLWKGWLAAGKMHILGGAPGTGKTTICIALAATVTTGGRWPDGTRSPVGNVVIWSGEDDPADTLIPRLALSGADLSRVYFIVDVLVGNERRSFDPARDMEPLRYKLAEIGDVLLLIVDPIVSAIAGDSHKNAEVRRGLQPLVDLAASMRCALLGITHFSKGTGGRDPVERLTGSLAFGALARVVLVAAKHQDEGEDGRTVRVFVRAKSNIGFDEGGFEYDLKQGELKTHPGIFASSVLWGEAVEGAARELLATADATGDDGEGGAMADAKRFLSDLLADGPLSAKTIRADTDGAGYSRATIRRAQKALGVVVAKEGGRFGGGKQQWVWRLPGSLKVLNNSEDAQQKKMSAIRVNEHLQEFPDKNGGSARLNDAQSPKDAHPHDVSTFRTYRHTCPHCAGEGCRWCQSVSGE